jgi:Uma2 family endonuclease
MMLGTQNLLRADTVMQIEQSDPPRSPREVLPTMYDLPSEDPEEPGLPDEFHDLQPQLLSRTLRLARYSQQNYFTASDLNFYYTVRHPLWHKRPDWFLVVDVPRLYEQRDLRRSYVLWQEGNPPDVVVEFLSPGTEAEDLGRFHVEPENAAEQEPVSASSAPVSLAGQVEPKAKPPGKFEVYETHLRVPHYFVYSRFTQRLRYFKLHGGKYQEQLLNPEPPLIWLTDLEIGLGIWQGEFEGVTAHWLRWCDRLGTWLLTDTEQAQQQLEQERQAKEQERQAKEQERQAKEQAQTQILQAARNLLATGMDLAQVAQIFNLSEVQAQALDQTPTNNSNRE